MKLSELHAIVQAREELLTYLVWLVAPDRDGVDVDLDSISHVEVDLETQEARLFPTSAQTDAAGFDSEALLGTVLSQLPPDATEDDDLRVVVRTRPGVDAGSSGESGFADICDIRVDHEVREVWLLTEVASAFPPGVLPG